MSIIRRGQHLAVRIEDGVPRDAAGGLLADGIDRRTVFVPAFVDLHPHEIFRPRVAVFGEESRQPPAGAAPGGGLLDKDSLAVAAGLGEGFVEQRTSVDGSGGM